MENHVWKKISRGVLEIIGEEDLKAKLSKGTPLNIKLGVDPTSPDIHLGFTVVMRKLREFQDMGHQVILVIGDYTATVGDPSGKNKTRPILTHEEVLKNAETYKEQFFKIVDPLKTKVVYNGDWFSRLSFNEVTKLMSQITVAQMLEREDFQNRYKNNQPISLHEFLYPMMQAFDSVKIDADVELGGMDQKFNVLRGRELQKSMGKEPQVGIFMPILLGLDGVQKMSKSLGNCIGINESARDMVRKIISMPDSLIRSFFELLTDVSLEEIEERLTTGDPRNLKETLALIIASKYHGARACFDAMEEERERNEAKKNGDNTFVPSDIPTFKISGTHAISWLLREAGLCASSTLATNFIKNRTVCWDGEVVSDPKQKVDISGEHILKLGNKKWAKICQN